ncbi:MAG: hypothetical protein PVG33_10785, partial [Chloroflexota bacterium]
MSSPHPGFPGSRKRAYLLFVLLLTAVLLAGCGGSSSEPTVTRTTAADQENASSQPKATDTPPPTETPQPSPAPGLEPTTPPEPTEDLSAMEITAADLAWSIDSAAGNGPGDDSPLKAPNGLSVDQEGNLYVYDAGNSRVLKFNAAGEPQAIWDEQGDGDGQLNSLGFGGLAVDSQGQLFVVDNGNHRIQKFDSQGNYLGQWGEEGAEDGQFIRAIGIAVDDQGLVYVTDDSKP